MKTPRFFHIESPTLFPNWRSTAYMHLKYKIYPVHHVFLPQIRDVGCSSFSKKNRGSNLRKRRKKRSPKIFFIACIYVRHQDGKKSQTNESIYLIIIGKVWRERHNKKQKWYKLRGTFCFSIDQRKVGIQAKQQSVPKVRKNVELNAKGDVVVRAVNSVLKRTYCSEFFWRKFSRKRIFKFIYFHKRVQTPHAQNIKLSSLQNLLNFLLFFFSVSFSE